jgi:hypothetical protein
MKTVSQIDDIGRFLSVVHAYESPRDPGVHLLPAGAVDMPPPTIPAGMYAQLIDGAWVFLILPAELQPDLPSIEQRRMAVWAEVRARREALKSGGVQVGDHWYHSDADSRIQQLGLLMMGESMPAGIMWRVLDNGLVEMTPALAQQIFQATAQWDAVVFGVAEMHRAAIEVSENPEAYDWTTGWPEGFWG